MGVVFDANPDFKQPANSVMNCKSEERTKTRGFSWSIVLIYHAEKEQGPRLNHTPTPYTLSDLIITCRKCANSGTI
ncbi:unnamed protein product [Dibothriocephalus latus]|uniref:Uncharacterized protein n=1 Tax=Dibothriocephalus latus TaxID=60516 RepID=A0A3P7LGZ6_DIBLA|nr:unnamed protein product [Dibothriocephalus latus]